MCQRIWKGKEEITSCFREIRNDILPLNWICFVFFRINVVNDHCSQSSSYVSSLYS